MAFEEADRVLSVQREEQDRPHSVRISGGKAQVEACTQTAASSTFFWTAGAATLPQLGWRYARQGHSISCCKEPY
jgi:hypothetical protein